jgi:DNA-binding response OmpR family regulator
MVAKRHQSILLIDDDKHNTVLLQTILEAKMPNLKVITATNGKVGINLAKKFKPDLILLDLMMPEPNGFKVCHALKSDENMKDTLIVIFSAMGDQESQNLSFEAGAIDFITKPIKVENLLDVILNILHGKRLGLYNKS